MNALLITPVQRIPRYKLLLDDIIKNTPRFHPDKENLTSARSQIDSIAWYINDQIKEYENNCILVDIQKSLQGGLPKIIKPDRKLIKQGNLMKVNKSGGHAQPRYVILFSDMIMYCKFRGSLLVGGTIELPRQDALEVCCVLPLKHTEVDEVVGKGVFTIKCQKEHLVLYSPHAEDSDWVDVIQRQIKTLRRNKASLRRESSMFEPMRKPDLVKMRRESLGKIMMMRKAEESKLGNLSKDFKLRSPLTLLTPKKRAAGGPLAGSPFKLKRLAEEVGDSPAESIISPNSDTADCPEVSPPLERSPVPLSQAAGASPDLVARRKPKSNSKTSLRSLTLGRLDKTKKKSASSASVFRSPSIYDEPGRMRLAVPEEREEDTMTSYLSGKICPLTPSTKPCNVDHLARKDPVSHEPDLTTPANEDDDTIKVHPIAIHDGILNYKKSLCTIS